jgi:hypothetical protein
MAAIPFIYLALAILFAAMESQFILCKYDPFVRVLPPGCTLYDGNIWDSVIIAGFL